MSDDNVDISSMTEEERHRYEKKQRKAAKKAAEAEAAAAAEAEAAEEERRQRKAAKKAAKAAQETEQAEEQADAGKKRKHEDDAAAPIETKKQKAPEQSQAPQGSQGGLKKFFYKAAASLASFTQAEVEEYRTSNCMAISGNGSEFPNFKPARSFPESGLPENVLSACSGFVKPTPIQAQSWPIALSGRDAVGIAETGSGKTLAFTLPGLTHILAQSPLGKGLNERGPVMLVLAPTRELAMQISEVTNTASSKVGLRSTVIYGGVDYRTQVGEVRSGQHVLVATPGRLLGMLRENDISLKRVTFLVLDEADRMLDMGFINDIRSIITSIPNPERQTLMFSATWPDAVQKLASEFLRNPIKITIGSEDLSANVRIQQIVEVLEVKQGLKDSRLDTLLRKYHDRKNKIIIFCLYKAEAARVERFLQGKGWNAQAIHGDKSQADRSKALADFKAGTVPLLVATDVAARGLDIPNVEYVLNYTFPLTVEDYVHRIGRTGRAGKTGISHTFFTADEKGLSGEFINVLKDANQPVPEALLAFGTHTKKREHALYGNHFRKDAGDQPMKAASKITFDD
jgi:ATP-dependent RNA helicase DBP3